MTLPLPRGAADRLALGLAYTVSPLALPMLALGVGAAALGAGPRETGAAVALAFGLGGLAPLALLLWLVRRGAVVSIEIRERTERTGPYLWGAACTLALAAALALTLGPPRRVLAIATAWQAANALVLMAVNLRWKISVHLAALAGTLALLSWLRIGGAAVPGGLLAAVAAGVPALAWARVRLGAHSAGQTLGGATFGLVATPLELWAST